MAKKQLEGCVALITGASRGIGAAVAVRFAQEGAHVVLAARSVKGLEQTDDMVRAAGGQATLVPLDLRQGALIDQLAASIAERFGKLDILVGNAAILGALTPLAMEKPAEWEEVINVNLTANWRLIRACDSLLRKSDAGRAIFVTSGVARAVFPYWGAYAASKAALEMLAKVYAAEIAKTSMRANILDPGVVRTSMRAAAFPGEDPMTLPPPESIADAFLALALPSCKKNGEIVKAY